MSSLAKILTAALQADHLKSLGFEKRYETFSRSHPKFSEHYHIQSSLLNKAGDPWKYDLIIGIGFNNIPVKTKGQLAGTHVSKRFVTIESILLDSDSKDIHKIKTEASRLAEIIRERTEYFQSRQEILRHSYDRAISHQGFPADPEFD